MGRRDGTPQAWLRMLNPIMRALGKLGAPVPMLELRGRSTGQLRRTPISPMEWRGVRYVVAGYANSEWALNARAAGTGKLLIGRRAQRVRFVELPADEARPVLREFPVRVPSAVPVLVNAGVVTDGSPDSFANLAGHSVVFRLEPV